MIVLVLNCGSSSLKYQLLDMKSDEVYDLIAKGLVERIGMETGCLKHQATGKEKLVKEMPIEDHTVGIRAVMDALLDKEYGVLTTLEDIEAVGHRVVHGAEEFVCSQLITDKVIAQLEKCSVFAPLHNPANILGIKAVSAVLPTVPQVGVFDTAFHQTMPSYAYMYALPYEYYEKYGVRRYGFHGNKGGNKNTVVHPQLKVVQDCESSALAYWRELGLTPASFKKLTETEVKQIRQMDPLSAAIKDLDFNTEL